MRQRARVDANHGEIVEALEAMGWGVKSTAQLGKGFPDLIAAKAGRLVLIEVKDGVKAPSKRKRTPDEVEAHAWFASYGVHVLLIERLEDLAQLDRDARSTFEGVQGRNFYKDTA